MVPNLHHIRYPLLMPIILHLPKRVYLLFGAARYDLKAASIGNYAIFAGGYNGGYYSTVDIYDSSLTRTTGTPLSEPKGIMAPGSNEAYAIFTGGYGSAGGYFLLTDVYDKSLTHTTISRSVNGSGAASVSMDGNIVVSGGYINDSSSGLQDYSTDFYVYDSSLTLTTPYRLSGKRNQHAMAYVGDYALVGGGYNGTSYVSSVEYFLSLFNKKEKSKWHVMRFMTMKVLYSLRLAKN